MLLREFVIDGHTICLNEKGSLYIAEVKNSSGEKLFYHEYEDYEKIKEYFDTIVDEFENCSIGIKRVLAILENSK